MKSSHTFSSRAMQTRSALPVHLKQTFQYFNSRPIHHSQNRHVCVIISAGSQRHADAAEADEMSSSSAAQADPFAFSKIEAQPCRNPEGSLNPFPDRPGVYGIYAPSGELQYIGLSRKVSATLLGYARDLPDLTHSVKIATPEVAGREHLIALWKEWMHQAVEETGKVPPGNHKDDSTWASKKPQKAEIKLTPGKGSQDLSCSIVDLVDQVVKSNKVVAFVKGTRMQPQCGFSYKVLSMLNEVSANYEVLNVLDETYNPGLREAIKEYSQWPTIPQLYVGGEFVGGADIVEEMHQSGELKKLVSAN